MLPRPTFLLSSLAQTHPRQGALSRRSWRDPDAPSSPSPAKSSHRGGREATGGGSGRPWPLPQPPALGLERSPRPRAGLLGVGPCSLPGTLTEPVGTRHRRQVEAEGTETWRGSGATVFHGRFSTPAPPPTTTGGPGAVVASGGGAWVMAGAPQRELACPGGRARSQERPVEARWALGHPLLEAAVSHATGGARGARSRVRAPRGSGSRVQTPPCSGCRGCAKRLIFSSCFRSVLSERGRGAPLPLREEPSTASPTPGAPPWHHHSQTLALLGPGA